MSRETSKRVTRCIGVLCTQKRPINPILVVTSEGLVAHSFIRRVADEKMVKRNLPSPNKEKSKKVWRMAGRIKGLPLPKLKKRCEEGDVMACRAHNLRLVNDSKSHRPRYDWRKHKIFKTVPNRR